MSLKSILAFAVTLILSLATSLRADITSDLVLYLPLNETTGVTASDSSGLGNNATLINPPPDSSQWTNGWINGGINLNNPRVPATTNYLSIANAPSLNFDTVKQYTLACWVKMPTAQIAGAGLIAHGTGGGGEQYDLDINASKFRIVHRNTAGTATVVSSVPNVSPNWQHVAVTWDGSRSNLIMYVNGLYSASNTVAQMVNLATAIASTDAVTVGARTGSAIVGYSLSVSNTITDEVRIYSRPLTPGDVFELFSLGSPGNPNGAVPTFTALPRSVTNYVGDSVIFTAAATAIPDSVFYRWLSNNVAIAGATNASLVLSNVQLSFSASYSVLASNIIGSATSAPAILQVQSLPAANFTSGLVGYWKFDEASGSSVAADSSGNNNPGALTGFNDLSSVWVAGITNGALKFNSDSSGGTVVAIPAVGTPGPAILDFSTSPAFTLVSWVNAPAATVQSNGAAIICRGAGGGGEQYAFDLVTAGYRFYIRNNSNVASVVSTTVRPNGTWQHLVAVFDAINGIQNIYVNGQLVGFGTAPLSLTTNGSNHEVTIGNRQSGTANYNLPFTGLMDDARIYNRALTSADARGLYLAGGVNPPSFTTQPQSADRFVGDDVLFSPVVSGTAPIFFQWRKDGTNIPGATNLMFAITNLQTTNAGSYTLFASNAYNPPALSAPAVLTVSQFVSTNSLAAFLKFDDGSGTTAIDSSTNNNNGTLIDFPPDNSEWVPGRINGSINFNPAGMTANYVSMADAPSLNFSASLQFSLVAWIRGQPGQIGGAAIICRGNGGGGEQFSLDIFPNVPRFYVRDAGGAASVVSSPIALNGSWQHVVATYDGTAGGTMRIYVNGALVGTAAGPLSLLNNSHEVTVGDRQNGSGVYNLPFAGMIDDVRIYNRALNAANVQQLYQSFGPLAPTIYSLRPLNPTALAGDSVTFTASAEGDGAVTYQWLKDSVIIPGATNLTYAINPVQISSAGTYTFRISNGITSASSNTVLTVQAVPGPNLTSSLIAYWPFDETSGLAAADASGNGNSLSLFNFPGDDTQWEPGIVGGALHINKGGTVNQSASTDNALNLFNGNLFSFSFWAKLDPNSIGVNPRIITPIGGVHWVLWTPGTGVGFFPPAVSTQPSSSVWTHFVVTYNRPGGTYSLYVNGRRQVSDAPGYVRADPTGAFWTLGHSETSSSTSDPWMGLLDDVRAYNRIINVNDVNALYLVAGRPFLTIAPSGGNVVVSWSSVVTGYNLQSSPVLGPGAVWTNVGIAPTPSPDGVSQSVTLNSQTGTAFYRLQKP